MIHQPRLWSDVNLSQLRSNQVNCISSTTKRSLGYKLKYCQGITVSCPSSMYGPDLYNIAGLIKDQNFILKRIKIERVQMSTPWAFTLVDSLPKTVECVSLRQTLSRPGLVRLLIEKLPSLQELDLSYTLVDDSTLELLGYHCDKLQKLRLDAVFTLSSASLKQFLEHDAPLSLTHVSVKNTMTQADWIFAFIKRQLKAGRQVLKNVDLERCDSVTLKDVESLRSLCGRCSEIKHTAVLTEDTLEGYRELLDKLSIS